MPKSFLLKLAFVSNVLIALIVYVQDAGAQETAPAEPVTDGTAVTGPTTTTSAISEPPAPPPPSSPPPPYSLPWQLRPAAATTVIRSDTAFARYENTKGDGGFTVASTLLASYKVPSTGDKWQGLAPVVRFAVVSDSPPALANGQAAPGGFAFVNPLVGATYAMSLGHGLRAAFFLGATIPVGMGGGDTPDKGELDARTKGPAARSMMDNSLFAVNDFTLIPGADIAWVAHGFTVQAEATLFGLWRVRGEKAQPESSKTNLTTGIHAGYFFIPELSVGVDLRYQRWLNAPIAIDKDPTGTLIDNWSFAVGPRFHFPLGGTVKIHPGVAYARYLDKPNAAATPNYHIVQLDIPVTF